MATISQESQMLLGAQAQLRAVVERLTELSRQDITEEQFFGQFLPEVVSTLGAVGGAVWLAAEGTDVCRLAFQVNLTQAGLDDPVAVKAHGPLIAQARQAKEGRLVSSNFSTDEGLQNPTSCMLLLAPLRAGTACPGVLEVFQRPNEHLGVQRGWLRFVQQMADLAADYWKHCQWRRSSERESQWREIEAFSRVIHAHGDVSQVAYTLANDGRRLIGCDRLSVAVARGRNHRIEAVSGQDVLDRRANTIQQLENVVARVVALGEPFWFDGTPFELAPQIAEVVEQYVDETHVRRLGIVPLRPEGNEGADLRKNLAETNASIGALVVEELQDSKSHEGIEARSQLVARHATLAVEQARRYEQVWFLPLWQSLARVGWLVRTRHLPKTATIAGAILIALLLLVIVPMDFTVHSPGVLRPTVHRDVFAPLDGTVEEVLVQHGDNVEPGQLLVRLRNTDIEVAITDVMGQYTASREQLASVERALHDETNRLSYPQRNELAGQRAELVQRLESLQKQWDLLRDKKSRLEIRSPVGGQVTTWNVEQLLAHRPVRTGQVLLNVAHTEGPWEVELQLPEHRVGHMVEASGKLDQPLAVTFRLATDPGVDHLGSVTEVHRSAEVRGEKGNSVLVKVAIDHDELGPLLRPGADVTAKVHCGRRSVGYVWFNDVVAFVQSKILFKLW